MADAPPSTPPEFDERVAACVKVFSRARELAAKTIAGDHSALRFTTPTESREADGEDGPMLHERVSYAPRGAVFKIDAELRLGLPEARAISASETFWKPLEARGLSKEQVAGFIALHEMGHAQRWVANNEIAALGEAPGPIARWFKENADDRALAFNADFQADLQESLRRGGGHYEAFSRLQAQKDDLAIDDPQNPQAAFDSKQSAYEEGYADEFAAANGAALFGWDPKTVLQAVREARLDKPAEFLSAHRDHDTSSALKLAASAPADAPPGTGARLEQAAALACKFNETQESDCSSRQDLLAGHRRLPDEGADESEHFDLVSNLPKFSASALESWRASRSPGAPTPSAPKGPAP